MKTKKPSSLLSFKKIRLPVASPGYAMETKKDYSRKINKQITKKEMESQDDE